VHLPRRSLGLLAVALAALTALPQAFAQDAAPASEGSEKDASGRKATMPRPINYAPPRYPEAAQREGLEATVTLQLDIDRNGRVTRAAVIEPAGHGFDEAAVEAAQKLDFEPARRPDGTPFSARILYRYAFTLKASEASPGGAGGGAAASEQTSQDAPAEPTPSPGAAATAGGETPMAGDPIEVTVLGDRPPREVTKRTISQRELSRIPGTNGDALRALQNMPGVARPPSLAGLLIVRGSAPQDSQTFIDGTPVPLIYHFFGLSSVVPTELLDKIDFYPGNFSAQYGRVLGGIIDASIRSPRDDGRLHGLVQLDLIDARLMLEGPIPFAKGWTFAAAGRRSHLDAWLGPVLEGAVAGVTQAPVYYDYQFIAETNPTQTSRLRVAFFGSDDAVALLIAEPPSSEPGLSGDFGLHTAFQRLQIRYTDSDFAGGRLSATLAFGRDNIDFGIGSFYFFVDTSNISSRVEIARRLSRGVTLNAGADFFAAAYNALYRGPAPPLPGEPANQPFSTRAVREGSFNGGLLNPAAYLEIELTPGTRAKIVPGVRVDGYNTAEGVDVSPRVNARYDIAQGFPRTTAKGGVGVFHQPPQLQEAVVPLGTAGLSASQAIHYSLGAEQELTEDLEVSAEGFVKQLDGLVVGTPSPSGAALVYKNIGRGYAVGSEILVKYRASERFFGWAAYTLSRSVRSDGPGRPERLFESDQTHSLTVLGSFKVGGGFEIGARFRLTSGDVVTPDICDPSADGCDASRPSALFHSPSGGYTPLPSSIGAYSERLPLFHQLDVRVDKRWSLGRFNVSAYLDVQNAYNHANIEGINANFNYTARSYSSGLPILPSVGLRADF
jgi:TonB family protein